MNRVKELRMARKLTQVELARRAGCDQQSITALETGRTKYPTLPLAVRLARALEVQPEDLMTEDEPSAQAACA